MWRPNFKDVCGHGALTCNQWTFFSNKVCHFFTKKLGNIFFSSLKLSTFANVLEKIAKFWYQKIEISFMGLKNKIAYKWEGVEGSLLSSPFSLPCPHFWPIFLVLFSMPKLRSQIWQFKPINDKLKKITITTSP
jgi:hypothetical protein